MIDPIRLKSQMSISAKILIGFISSLLLNSVLLLFGQGSIVQKLVTIAAILPLAALITTIGVYFLLKNGSRVRQDFDAGWSCIIAGVTAGSCLISLPIGSYIVETDVAAAMAYCEKLSEEIDQHYEVYGEYPIALPVSSSRDRPPRLLAGKDFYKSYGSEYRFDFSDPSRIFAGYAYASENRIWSYWD